MRILNGKKFGDLLGYYTCFTPLGTSSVDYGAVSPKLFDHVPYFSVAPPCLQLSDHAPIELGLKVMLHNVPVNSNDSNDVLLPKPEKIEWDTNLAQKYKLIIESPDCKEILNGFVNTGVLPYQNSVDSAVSFVSNILVETAKQAGMQFKKGVLPRRSARAEQPFKRIKHPKWHDDDCHVQLRQLKSNIPEK